MLIHAHDRLFLNLFFNLKLRWSRISNLRVLPVLSFAIYCYTIFMAKLKNMQPFRGLLHSSQFTSFT